MHKFAYLLAALSLSAFSPAHADDGSWQLGLDSLHRQMFVSELTQTAYAVRDRAGTVRWVNKRTMPHKHEETFASEIQGFAESNLTNGETLCYFQARPMLTAGTILLIRRMDVEKIFSQKSATISMPPSVREIDPFSDFGMLHVSGLLNKSGDTVVRFIMDPSRIWRFREATEEDLQSAPRFLDEARERKDVLRRWDQRMIEMTDAFPPETIDNLLKYASLSDLEFIASLAENAPSDEDLQLLRHAGLMDALNMRDIKEGAIIWALFEGSPQIAARILNTEADRQLQRDMQRINAEMLSHQRSLENFIDGTFIPDSMLREPSEELLHEIEIKYLSIGTVVESFTLEEARQHPETVCR